MSYRKTSPFLIIDQEKTPKLWGFGGRKGESGVESAEFTKRSNALAFPFIHADPRLNDLLLKYCEAALADRRADMSQLRTRVENAISPMLPHGRVLVEDI